MFEDSKQQEKAIARRNIVKQYIASKEIDNKSFEYFMDVIDDLSSCIDLKLGKIDNVSKYDPKTIERMNLCGECLLNEELDETSKEFVDQYIDSVIVEYAKFGYEVGLLFYKDKLNDFTNKYYNHGIKDYHDALIRMTKSFTANETEKKSNKKLTIA